MNMLKLRRLELNRGKVQEEPHWRFTLPPTAAGYADAQIDDYGLDGSNRQKYPWRPGTEMHLRARFSHSQDQLLGTAGFGFWNAPFGDPNIRWPALPQAAWFFYASAPTDLPLAPDGPGRGWFAATLDATTPSALSMIPAAPFVLLLNQFAGLRLKIWPNVQRLLQISFAPISEPTQEWHTYKLSWLSGGCSFSIDDKPILQTPFSPSGPLGFVCWIDNQYLIATSRGRFRWGTLETKEEQTLEVAGLSIQSTENSHH